MLSTTWADVLDELIKPREHSIDAHKVGNIFTNPDTVTLREGLHGTFDGIKVDYLKTHRVCDVPFYKEIMGDLSPAR